MLHHAMVHGSGSVIAFKDDCLLKSFEVGSFSEHNAVDLRRRLCVLPHFKRRGDGFEMPYAAPEHFLALHLVAASESGQTECFAGHSPSLILVKMFGIRSSASSNRSTAYSTSRRSAGGMPHESASRLRQKTHRRMSVMASAAVLASGAVIFPPRGMRPHRGATRRADRHRIVAGFLEPAPGVSRHARAGRGGVRAAGRGRFAAPLLDR